MELYPIGESSPSTVAPNPQYDETTRLTETSRLPEGWKKHIHPDGNPYFLHRDQRLVTANDLTSPSVAEIVLDCIEAYQEECGDEISDLEDYHIHITVDEEDGLDYRCEVIDHRGHKNVLYWSSYGVYPVLHDLPESTEDDVVASLAYFATEITMGNSRTTSPYKLDACLDILALLSGINKHKHFQHMPGHTNFIVSDAMFELFIYRKKYHYGSLEAITTILAAQKIEPPSWTLQVVDICLRVLCFGAHLRYRRRFSRSYTNGGLDIETFRDSLKGTLKEWSDSNLLGFVLTSADLSLLSLPDLTNTQRTIVLVSINFSIVSTLVGMYLVWQHRPRSKATIGDTWEYLHHATGTLSSVQYTGILLCIPFVLLLWSIITFSTAILFITFEENRGAAIGILALTASIAVLGAVIGSITGGIPVRSANEDEACDGIPITLE